MCYVEFINIGALWIHHSAVIPIVPIGKQAAVLHGTGHYSLGCMALTPSPHPPLTLMQHCEIVTNLSQCLLVTWSLHTPSYILQVLNIKVHTFHFHTGYKRFIINSDF